MLYLPWRRKALTLTVTTLCLQATLVKGININYCSTENTGSSTTPNNYDLQSLGHCRDQCGGYAFAIAQGKACWCSDYAPSTSIDDSSCNQQCPGYPYEVCGSTGGAYSYIQIGSPSGTGGPFTANPFAAAPSSSAPPSPVPPSSVPPVVNTIVSTPPANTVYQTIENTVTSNNVVIRTTAIIQTSVYSPEPETVTRVQTALISVTPSAITHVVSVTPHPSSNPRPSTTLRPETSIQYLTVSGAVQTRVISSYPSETGGFQAGSAADVRATRQGLSNGAVAGIVIGVVAALALAGLLLFCCCRRRKEKKTGGGLNRNTSVLSRVGLLRHGSTRPSSGAAIVPISNSAPRLDTAIPGTSGPPSTISGGMLERKNSRPLFQDQRLNPNALMVHSDTSRTSVGTLQDNEDYSRPLKVANPDPGRP